MDYYHSVNRILHGVDHDDHADTDTESIDTKSLAVIKGVSMLILFFMVIISGSLPLKVKYFRKSDWLVSLLSAFSGGLFLAVGILHLMDDANEYFEAYYESKKTDEESDDGDDEHFPWVNFITVVSFAFILFIEKVAFKAFLSDDHEHGNHSHSHLPFKVTKPESDANPQGTVVPVTETEALTAKVSIEDNQVPEPSSLEVGQKKKTDEKEPNRIVKFFEKAKKQMVNEETDFERIAISAPFLLQIAIGIHGIFEGIAIGIVTDKGSCLGTALAVLCHKWAEGLTLGLAFFKAGVKVKVALPMIVLQAIMNPIGIGIGWGISSQGYLVTGVFQSISAGTFLYISTSEVITHEFNLKRYTYIKFCLFMIAVGFVASLYFIEQAASD